MRLIQDIRLAMRHLLKAPGLVIVALLAAFIPARRAAAIEPLEALRME